MAARTHVSVNTEFDCSSVKRWNVFTFVQSDGNYLNYCFCH